MKKRYVSKLLIVARKPGGSEARLTTGPMSMPCRIGRAGSTHQKREGDGRSPAASLRILRGWWRADRRRRPLTGLPMAPLTRWLGWCDAPGHGQYNRAVRLPFAASHEIMWRSDRQYDVVLELGWNTRPRIQGRGSAIFLHLTAAMPGGTAGCIAVAPQRIDRLMARIGPRTMIAIR